MSAYSRKEKVISAIILLPFFWHPAVVCFILAMIFSKEARKVVSNDW